MRATNHSFPLKSNLFGLHKLLKAVTVVFMSPMEDLISQNNFAYDDDFLEKLEKVLPCTIAVNFIPK